ncbi:MAG: NAD(P)-binding protein [Deltaproteobacteria bacterium]|nr:NAD(P)-binding protein [Deltaproteobacteria bacterium]
MGESKATNKERNLIIGAGLAGLSCGHHLPGPSCILEKQTVAGGLARSFERKGFTSDFTGHWLHMRDPSIRTWIESLMGDELITVERTASIFSHGIHTPYPFQANTYGLPHDVVTDCLLGFFAAREKLARGDAPEVKSFEDYIRQRMGDGIADHFMVPYNTKIFTIPPSQMSHEWCERFVPIPKPEEVVRGALSPMGASHGLGYNATFQYPKSGGIGRLPQRLYETSKSDIRLGEAVTRINWKQKEVSTSSGQSYGYTFLVSTLPLKDLILAMEDVPAAVLEAAQKLRATSVTYWDIGLKGKNPEGAPHWTYFPEKQFPFYRIGSASAAVPQVAPEDHRSYYVEVSHLRGTPCSYSAEDILKGLRCAGYLKPNEDPVLLNKTTIDCAYVLMDHAYGQARATVMEFLESCDILSIGRYGSWTYDSMEGALVQGKDTAQSLASRQPRQA